MKKDPKKPVKKDKEATKDKDKGGETKVKAPKTGKASGHKTVQSETKLEPKKHEPTQSEIPKSIAEDVIEDDNAEKGEPEDFKHSYKESMPLGKSDLSQAKETDWSRQTKKFNDDKMELMQQLTALRKENDDIKKKNKTFEKENEQLYKDIAESQKRCQEFLKEMNEMSTKTKKTMKEFETIQAANEEYKKKLQILEEDNEVLKEELETKELELQVNEKNYNDKLIQIVQSQETQEETQKQQQQSQPVVSSQAMTEEQRNKMAELEEIVSELSQNLLKANEERDYAIKYYKSQIEDLNQKINLNKDQLDSIPKKDELIRQLTEKLQDVEGIIEVLQTQITALSPANNMYEQIIIEKDELEIKYQELFKEHKKLKEDFNEDEELIREQESIMKLSEKMIQTNQDELLNSKKIKEEQQQKLIDSEEKEKALMDKIAELKKINQIIKEEISKAKDVNINIDDVLNKNISTSSKIKMYERQRVLYTLESIETKGFTLLKRIINTMIPRKMLDIGSLDSFEKFITIQSLRKKTFALIFSLIDNDLLNDELLFPVTSSIDTIEADNLKKTIAFYSLVVNTIMDFNCALFSLEIYLSKELKQIATEEYKQLYLNVLAGKQLIDILIGMIKEDSFSIQYQTNCEGLRTIVNKLNDQITSVCIGRDNLMDYYKALLCYFVNVIKAFRKDRIELMLLDNEQREQAKLEDTSKSLLGGFKNIRKVLNKIDEKFFVDIKYEFTAEIFDINSSYYSKVQRAIETSEYETEIEQNQPSLFITKYEKLVDLSNKLCVVATSSIEKYEKDNPPSFTEETHLLPVREWNAITKVLNDELESISKTKNDLDKALEAVKEARLEHGKLQSKFDELSRSKLENDNQLASLLVKIGKIDQLESENLEYQKKVEKYKTAVDDLSKKDERNKIELNKYKRREEEQQFNPSRPVQGANKKTRFAVAHASGMANDMSNLGTTFEILDLLKKESKYLKSKIIKEKLNSLIEDDSSYLNKYIKTDIKIAVEETEKDFIQNVSEKIKNITKGYEDIREKLSFPSILDIADNKNNYSQVRTNEENRIRNIRGEYMKNANGILSEMFGDKALSTFIHEQIDYDISKTLKGFEESKVSIGRIRIQQLKKSKDAQPPCVIPLLLSEASLKSLNKTFIN